MNISVVTISFNQAAFLPQAIASVESQMQRGDEHVIVDPGSRDGSREILAEYAARDARVVLSLNPDNGPADGLNRGFEMCRKDVICYINADDFLLAGALDFARNVFSRNPAVDILLGAIKIAAANGSLRRRGRVCDDPTLHRLKAGAWQYYQQGTFIRRRSLLAARPFNEANRTCWDRELVVDMVLSGRRARVSSRPLAAFRFHDASITSGGVSERYKADVARINARIRVKLGRVSPLLRSLYDIERRLNVYRYLQQFTTV